MAVQSIRTPVQVGDIARNHFLVAALEMSGGKMDCVGELDHLPQEIGPRAETLDDSRNLMPSGTGAPEVISSGGFARGFGVLDDFDLRGRLCRVGRDAFVVFCVVSFIRCHGSHSMDQPYQVAVAIGQNFCVLRPEEYTS